MLIVMLQYLHSSDQLLIVHILIYVTTAPNESNLQVLASCDYSM